MKAVQAKLLDLLKTAQTQFQIPIYQRTYSWTEEQCRQLWDDILRAGNNNEIPYHFVGSIVYIEEEIHQATVRSSLWIIDGQQRLTTVSLIIEALARQLGDDTEPTEGFSAEALRTYYLLDPRENGDRRYKLLLTQTDKETLLSLVSQRSLPNEHSVRIKQNFKFFENQIQKLSSNLSPLWRGLTKLTVVDIALDREHDNPQLIFESMNSTGLALSQADLIRNFVLMGLKPEHQTRLYEDYWHRMELAFGQEAYREHFDGFMRHYLTVKTGKIPKEADVYSAFKTHASSEQVDSLVAELHDFAGYYCAMALGKETHPTLVAAFADLGELNVKVAYPLLLELYHDYSEGILSAEELEQAVRLVESYIFRRAVCGIPTNSHNKTFSTFSQALKKDRYLESIQAHFLFLESYRCFPNDEDFCDQLKARDLYNFRNRGYWLRRLENYGRKERVPVNQYTTEHIMPQNENLSVEWQSALGDNWKQVQEQWLNKLGNLTLTRYNPEYSDRPFAEKRDMEGGFRYSPLWLNEGLGEVETWNECSICARADRLASKAVKVWPAPSLAAGVLDSYRSVPAKPSSYTIDDHRYLAAGGITRTFFDTFRKEVLAIDRCVSEEFLKLYVAFKAETNFVDVIPRAHGLRLSLNMRFHELEDPLRIARDVTNLGRWGNGDVEVDLNNLENLPYVMGMVRQAFEKQMHNGEGEE